MDQQALFALSQGWTDSIGIIFSFGVLLPAIATVCIVVSIIQGRGDKEKDSRNGGRWGRDSSE
jgi:hypothetical protein